MQKIDWCEGGLQLADIGTKNVSEPDLTRSMKYNGNTWELKTEHFYNRGDRVKDSHEEQEFWMTRLDWVGIRLNQFEMFEEHEKCLSRWKQCYSSWKQCWMKTMYK